MTFTTDPSLKLQAIAAALATTFGAIDDLTVLSYEPTGAAITHGTVTIGTVGGGSTQLREADYELGFRDWPQRWTVRLHVGYQAPEVNWAEARGWMGRLIATLDMDPHLGGEVREASVTDYSLELNDPEETTRWIVGEITVSVIHHQPNDQ